MSTTTTEAVERGILFSTQMVQAILRKRNPKRCTRRAARDQDPGDGKLHWEYVVDHATWPPQWKGKKSAPYTGWIVKYPNLGLWLPRRCPFGQVGDRLWVRETWRHSYRGANPTACTYLADAGTPRWISSHSLSVEQALCSYDWRPSIHMPRWASRILLEITHVWVERLQSISEAGARREGAPRGLYHLRTADNHHALPERINYREGFANLWDSLNLNARGGRQWGANPWVWAIDFRVISRSKYA